MRYCYVEATCASVFFLLFIFDLFYFHFHPFQLHIVVDLSEKTDQDRMILRRLVIESELETEHRSQILAESFGRDANRISLNVNNVQQRKQNSYLRVYRIYEYRTILHAAML